MIFFVGMPACGKTHWGKLVSKQYTRVFFDLDDYIEKGEGQSINEIFLSKGEPYFREIEHRYLARIIDLSTNDTVIATGGGTPCFHQNMGMIKLAGKVVYLKATIEELLNNLNTETKKRPILSDNEDIGIKLQDLLKQRSPYYEEAHFILQTANLSLANFEQIII